MITDFPWVYALIAGVVINVGDVGCTLIFAAKAWETELRRQGLVPSNWTPPYYVLVNSSVELCLPTFTPSWCSRASPARLPR